jgi:hypothetical protein
MTLDYNADSFVIKKEGGMEHYWNKRKTDRPLEFGQEIHYLATQPVRSPSFTPLRGTILPFRALLKAEKQSSV